MFDYNGGRRSHLKITTQKHSPPSRMVVQPPGLTAASARATVIRVQFVVLLVWAVFAICLPNSTSSILVYCCGYIQFIESHPHILQEEEKSCRSGEYTKFESASLEHQRTHRLIFILRFCEPDRTVDVFRSVWGEYWDFQEREEAARRVYIKQPDGHLSLASNLVG